MPESGDLVCIYFFAAHSGAILLRGTLDNKPVGYGSDIFLLLEILEYEPDQDSDMYMVLYYDTTDCDSCTVQQDAPVDDNDSGMAMLDNLSHRPVDGDDSGMVLLDAVSNRPVDDCGFLFHALYLHVLWSDVLHYSPVDFSESVCFQ
jgi:hypothetical protein